MTYFELLSKANRLLDKGDITIGQRDEMTKPLWDEIRPKGEWIRKPNEHRVDIFCTNCGYDDGYMCFKYCPNCGAKMKGGDKK